MSHDCPLGSFALTCGSVMNKLAWASCQQSSRTISALVFASAAAKYALPWPSSRMRAAPDEAQMEGGEVKTGGQLIRAATTFQRRWCASTQSMPETVRPRTSRRGSERHWRRASDDPTVERASVFPPLSLLPQGSADASCICRDTGAASSSPNVNHRQPSGKRVANSLKGSRISRAKCSCNAGQHKQEGTGVLCAGLRAPTRQSTSRLCRS